MKIMYMCKLFGCLFFIIKNHCRYDDVVLVEHKTSSVQVVSRTPSLSPSDDTTCGHIWHRAQCGALEQRSVVGMTDRLCG